MNYQFGTADDWATPSDRRPKYSSIPGQCSPQYVSSAALQEREIAGAGESAGEGEGRERREGRIQRWETKEYVGQIRVSREGSVLHLHEEVMWIVWYLYFLNTLKHNRSPNHSNGSVYEVKIHAEKSLLRRHRPVQPDREIPGSRQNLETIVKSTHIVGYGWPCSTDVNLPWARLLPPTAGHPSQKQIASAHAAMGVTLEVTLGMQTMEEPPAKWRGLQITGASN